MLNQISKSATVKPLAQIIVQIMVSANVESVIVIHPILCSLIALAQRVRLLEILKLKFALATELVYANLVSLDLAVPLNLLVTRQPALSVLLILIVVGAKGKMFVKTNMNPLSALKIIPTQTPVVSSYSLPPFNALLLQAL